MQNANYNCWNMNSFEFQNMNKNKDIKTALNTLTTDNQEKERANNMQYNGRLFLTPKGNNVKSYDLFKNSSKEACGVDNLFTNQEKTDLSLSYFSKTNLDKLQNKIIESVLVNSNGEYRIGRQSDLQLQIIMRSIYLTYGKNATTNINQQIEVLNEKVLQETLKSIMPSIKQYLYYKKDISTPRHIITHAVNVNSKGEKGLIHPYFN